MKRGESLIGRKPDEILDSSDFKDGYRIISNRNNRSMPIIKRRNAKSGYPQLAISTRGTLQPSSSQSNRISKPGLLARNLGTPEHHQAHHLIPDEVVRDHPLTQAARQRGTPLYNLDDKDNGISLPSSPEGKSISPHLPLHSGSHSRWNQCARDVLNHQLSTLKQKFGSVDKIPSEQLTIAVKNVEIRLRERIYRWKEMK